MESYFQPSHLLAKEIDYELRIRNVVSDRPQADKRKILGRLLGKERQSQADVLVLIDPKFDFALEKLDINSTLDSIKELISDFEGPSSDSIFKRAKTRIAHVTLRVQRLKVDSSHPEHEVMLKFKNESYASCLQLDAELHDKCKETYSVDSTSISNSSPNTPAPCMSSNVHSSNKSFPVYKLGVKFDGNPDNLFNFIEQVEELANARNILKTDLFASVSDLFTGNATFWLRQVKPQINDWDSLITRLKRDFLKSTVEDDIWNEIRSHKQKFREPVVIFIAYMETLFVRLGHPVCESTKIKYIKLGLHQEYRDRLALHEISSVEELSKLCKRLEEAEILGSSSKRTNSSCMASISSSDSSLVVCPSNNPCVVNLNSSKTHDHRINGSSNNSKSRDQRNKFQAKPSYETKDTSDLVKPLASMTNNKTVSCWKCGGPNHVFKHCSLKTTKKFCMKCGKPNFTVRTCPKCSQSGNE